MVGRVAAHRARRLGSFVNVDGSLPGVAANQPGADAYDPILQEMSQKINTGDLESAGEDTKEFRQMGFSIEKAIVWILACRAQLGAGGGRELASLDSPHRRRSSELGEPRHPAVQFYRLIVVTSRPSLMHTAEEETPLVGGPKKEKSRTKTRKSTMGA